MEPDTLRLTELLYCTAEDDEVVTTVAEANVTALAHGWPVRGLATGQPDRQVVAKSERPIVPTSPIHAAHGQGSPRRELRGHEPGHQ